MKLIKDITLFSEIVVSQAQVNNASDFYRYIGKVPTSFNYKVHLVCEMKKPEYITIGVYFENYCVFLYFGPHGLDSYTVDVKKGPDLDIDKAFRDF